MNGENLKIEGFSPNCLLGVTSAVANKKYEYEINNLFRLYFHHSFVYDKNSEIECLMETGGLNIMFSRQLPITKEVFIKRLSEYYGLFHRYNEYENYEKLISDIYFLNSCGEPVMIEIDFFFMKKHRFYKTVHDQHMMIIYDVDFEHKEFSVCEAVFGYYKMSFDEYFEYFSDVIKNRNRRVYILTLHRNELNRDNKINLDYFIEDVDKSLRNLFTDNGLRSFNDFYNDLSSFLKRNDIPKSFFVPGMWVFMCDSMNNVNFIKQFKIDYPDFKSETLDTVRRSSIISNRKWFYLTMAFNDVSKYNTEDLIAEFEKLKDAEFILADNLKILREDLINYR